MEYTAPKISSGLTCGTDRIKIRWNLNPSFVVTFNYAQLKSSIRNTWTNWTAWKPFIRTVWKCRARRKRYKAAFWFWKRNMKWPRWMCSWPKTRIPSHRSPPAKTNSHSPKPADSVSKAPSEKMGLFFVSVDRCVRLTAVEKFGCNTKSANLSAGYTQLLNRKNLLRLFF